jgi:hypothetical protein
MSVFFVDDLGGYIHQKREIESLFKFSPAAIGPSDFHLGVADDS